MTTVDSALWTIELPEVADTEAFGARLGALLTPGDLVLLAGPLGAGKTALTRGIGAGLGVRGQVSSPTFVIARAHKPGERGIPLVHVDAYRLSGFDEMEDLDLETDLSTSAVVVEWGEGVAEGLAEQHLLIRLERREDETRVATVSGTPRLLAGLRQG
ncbi:MULTISPECIES: tRNA (adenosine(37)-N6)-threonylcarbamoyltransferase complex ATPase subunit type 1 TsaE [unclassified Crossiella]|uniref:tRNA (adenosine(37)-N6)-threonylcarbamoyltransferase complex ATPase subunit type 1 TsaE n=1 Tax=unclassified Crossiella TaxID=2620835 RepID=UPI001FFF3228|nr:MULTISPECIES: tRNA (adenosine(37)-N6)-threonylcarbamoyltransferase complex ATPase subunit type 1 TsaE [unclassified Crossiella]MCK2236924.1 tRNA (adenosine(37)-N6)-threonylcarbamoyltransferase complex ATPase subunit type 1 TsaE [Crossiella sp. S99.2]MCK2250592.1 tRNA (adenosine(37)-N6)-threonylcarbamoyltransferase complex ATPase subunit type 1 TsaE [Crossiella sp. S99.1]